MQLAVIVKNNLLKNIIFTYFLLIKNIIFIIIVKIIQRCTKHLFKNMFINNYFIEFIEFIINKIINVKPYFYFWVLWAFAIMSDQIKICL